MSITRGLGWCVAVALLVSVVTATSQGAEPSTSSDPASERPPTVVVSVRDEGFHWTDAGVGAAAALATTLLALGLVLALRPDRGVRENP
jgi:hypothetical protein